MLQTLLIINLFIFIPLILFIEFFRSVDEYFESTTRKEAFLKGYLPYLFLFLAINSIALLYVFPVNVYESFSIPTQFTLFFADAGVFALSTSGLLISLFINKWRARYGTYTTRVRQ